MYTNKLNNIWSSHRLFIG